LISYTSNLPADRTTREVQVRYQDSISAKSYLAPSTREVAETTPAPPAKPAKKQPEKAGLGSLDAILKSNGIVLHGDSKQITVDGSAISFSQDSDSKSSPSPRATPETETKSVKAPEWLPVPDGAKGLSISVVGARKQLVFNVDQPIDDVVDFYQQRLTGSGFHIVTAGGVHSQLLLVTGSGKNAEIEIGSHGENQTAVRIAYQGE
jgi:hypothetical protein